MVKISDDMTRGEIRKKMKKEITFETFRKWFGNNIENPEEEEKLKKFFTIFTNYQLIENSDLPQNPPMYVRPIFHRLPIGDMVEFQLVVGDYEDIEDKIDYDVFDSVYNFIGEDITISGIFYEKTQKIFEEVYLYDEVMEMLKDVYSDDDGNIDEELKEEYESYRKQLYRIHPHTSVYIPLEKMDDFSKWYDFYEFLHLFTSVVIPYVLFENIPEYKMLLIETLLPYFSIFFIDDETLEGFSPFYLDDFSMRSIITTIQESRKLNVEDFFKKHRIGVFESNDEEENKNEKEDEDIEDH